MVLQQKADIASGSTVAFSWVALLAHKLNVWAGEYMPLITAFGILGGTALTAWYYWQLINQRKRDRALEHKRMEHERAMRDL